MRVWCVCVCVCVAVRSKQHPQKYTVTLLCKKSEIFYSFKTQKKGFNPYPANVENMVSS